MCRTGSLLLPYGRGQSRKNCVRCQYSEETASKTLSLAMAPSEEKCDGNVCGLNESADDASAREKACGPTWSFG